MSMRLQNARIHRVEIVVFGAYMLEEPLVHETDFKRVSLTEHGVEIQHEDGHGYQLLPWQRIVRIDFREDDL